MYVTFFVLLTCTGTGYNHEDKILVKPNFANDYNDFIIIIIIMNDEHIRWKLNFLIAYIAQMRLNTFVCVCVCASSQMWK